MAISVQLPDDVGSELVAEAASRDVTPDELAAEFIAARLSGRPPIKSGHRLGLGAIGASTSGRRAAEDEEMLAEGFGR